MMDVTDMALFGQMLMDDTSASPLSVAVPLGSMVDVSRTGSTVTMKIDALIRALETAIVPIELDGTVSAADRQRAQIRAGFADRLSPTAMD